MTVPRPSRDSQRDADGSVSIDERLLSNILAVVSSAVVYRGLMADYLARQAAYVEQGKTVDELVIGSWQLFEEVARAENRLFSALDALEEAQAISDESLPWAADM